MENFTPKLKNRYRLIDGKPTIELKLKTPHQLFDERDPAPFRERDLDDDAVQYILSSYRELPGREAKLSLYFAGMGDFEGHSDTIRRAIHSHFEYEGELKHRQLRDILKQGFISLLIGLTFLVVLTWFSMTMHSEDSLFRSLMNEWLHLMGWVSMWKPISIFLYDWWPIRSSMKELYELAEIEIEIHALERAALTPTPVKAETVRPLPLATSTLKTS